MARRLWVFTGQRPREAWCHTNTKQEERPTLFGKKISENASAAAALGCTCAFSQQPLTSAGRDHCTALHPPRVLSARPLHYTAPASGSFAFYLLTTSSVLCGHGCPAAHCTVAAPLFTNIRARPLRLGFFPSFSSSNSQTLSVGTAGPLHTALYLRLPSAGPALRPAWPKRRPCTAAAAGGRLVQAQAQCAPSLRESAP